MTAELDEVQIAQDRLGRQLERARSAEDRELSRQVREIGEQFARILYGLLRLTKLHALDNAAFKQPVAEWVKVQTKLMELLGTVHLICVEDQVYVNDVRIRFEMAHDHIEALGSDLRRHNVGGISFNEQLDEDKLRFVIQSLAAKPDLRGARHALQAKLNDAGLSSMELHGPFRFRLKGERTRKADRSFTELYQQSATVVSEAYRNLSANRMPNPLPVRRLVNELIDNTNKVDASELAQEHDERLPPFARHVLMVTNLSLMIGRGAKLPETTLGDLGVAGMFHDVGMSVKEDGYFVPYARHHAAGLRTLMRQRGFHEAKVRRLLAVVEHHRPFFGPLGNPSLFARIIHIADDYDILTRYRPGQGPVLAQADALARMAAQGGKAYDPVLLQVFINKMGLFPPGSILRLASGRVVVSVSGARSKKTFSRPVCRLVREADGSKPEGQVLVDLARGDRVKKVLRPGDW
jgi:HD-GYP domain-containing protein (c-di-GMP phosphodiesterase class II)